MGPLGGQTDLLNFPCPGRYRSSICSLNMVDAAGVEPAMPLRRRIYSPLGLPIFLHIQ